MSFITAPPYRLFYKSIALTLLPASLLCSPLNNVYDSQPLYNHLCSDKVYRKHKGMEMRFSLSPLYQHANTARNSDGSKVPGGDRLGEWNFFGLFFDDGHNTGPSLASKPIGSNYPNLKKAQDAIGGVTIQDHTTPTKYRVGDGLATPPTSAGTLHGAGDLTVKSQFSKLKAPFAYASVPTSYEKIGIRGHMSVELALGLGFSVRGGAVEIKNKPRQFVARQLLIDTGFITGEGIPTPSADDTADATIIYNALFADQKPRNDVADELHYNLKLFHKNSPEDVHAQLFWHLPLAFHEKSGDLAVTMVPYVAIGAWIPLSEKFDHDNAFAVPFGNMQQTFGLTADATVSFDFPVLPASGNGKQSFGISFGGGALLFGAVTDTDQRFPSSELQQGLVPWKVASIRRSPGATWYINTSLKAEEFVEGLSLYADYCYTQHLSDSITISDVTAKKTLFQDGVARSQDDSSWKNQQLSFGFNYAITNNISLNAAAQGHISGVRVYRTTTLLGGLTVTF